MGEGIKKSKNHKQYPIKSFDISPISNAFKQHKINNVQNLMKKELSK
jgi:hypothetical protein